MDFKDKIAALVCEAAGIEGIAGMLEEPPSPDMGDCALPCFKLAKTLRKAPPAIAAEIAEKLVRPAWLRDIQVAGGYLNFFLNRAAFAEETLRAALTAGDEYGRSDMGAGKTVVMDYSSINIAKPFHIGHLSTTAIGNSLYRIYGYLGYTPVGVNHLGDWGTQFGKLICAYKRWGDEADIEKRSIHALLELYVRFHEEAEKQPALEDEARAWFKRIEEGDSEALAIFGRFKEVTLREVGKVYEKLGVKFDSYAGESFYNDKMQPVIDKLRELDLLEESEGAYVVRLDAYDMPPCIILKKDGTTLYATRDLAAAFYRKSHYNFHKCLYIVAYQQNLHFRQIFKVLELMGCDWAGDMEHVAFGMVSLADGTLSTRRGKVVFLEDVLRKATEKTLAVINEKNPELADKEKVAEDVGVGAVVFSALSNSRIKDIVFDYDRVLNFDGETGPYVQYTHARACSLLRRAGDAHGNAEPDFAALDNGAALAAVKLLAAFPQTIVRACEKNEPSIITRFTIDLAQAFNKFYYDYRIIDEDAGQTAARLMLAKAVEATLRRGLWLIGVKAPERM